MFVLGSGDRSGPAPHSMQAWAGPRSGERSGLQSVTLGGGGDRTAAPGSSRASLHPLKCHVGGSAAGGAVGVMRWTSVAAVHPCASQTSRGPAALEAVTVCNVTHQS